MHAKIKCFTVFDSFAKWHTAWYHAWRNLEQSSKFLKRDVIVEFAGWEQVVFNNSAVKYRRACVQRNKQTSLLHTYSREQCNDHSAKNNKEIMMAGCVGQPVRDVSIGVVLSWIYGHRSPLSLSLTTNFHSFCQNICWKARRIILLNYFNYHI